MEENFSDRQTKARWTVNYRIDAVALEGNRPDGAYDENKKSFGVGGEIGTPACLPLSIISVGKPC